MKEQQCFSSLKSQKKQLLRFHKVLQQLFDFDYIKKWKFKRLLGDANNESSKFATRKWYAINDQNNTDYGE